ncbi:MAG: aldehyde dehydrogenase family protein [Rhodobacterales bacterium]|nr:aldehyde dehydrogenase family protein [Rhodobacterales bacterium]
MAKELTELERKFADELLSRAKSAQNEIENWTQSQLDRLSQAIAWYSGNEKTFTRLAQQGVDESGIGDREGRPAKRFKIHMVLRDVLRTPSTGIVETDEKRGLVKYAKPVGVIASLIPMTNPAMTPPVTGVSSANARNAVIFSPHPRTAKTTFEMVEAMRDACEAAGAPRDLFQSIRHPSIPLTQYLMEICDLTLATGGKPMVKAAYSSGKPAYGVGAGNSSIVIDETADVAIAAQNTRISKTSDFGSGCSADGNIIIQKSIYQDMITALINEGGYLCDQSEKDLLEKAMWDEKGNRTFPTIACKPQQTADVAGFSIPDDRKFLMVDNQGQIGENFKFCKEKLTTLMSLYCFEQFDEALTIVKSIYQVGGKGHSCGIYSHDDKNIDALARIAPVSRMMVRQPQSKANAGSWTNGMPMTSSLGCGVWGGNITNENVTIKHMMNYTWVSRPIAEDRPSEQELFGEFFGQEVA